MELRNAWESPAVAESLAIMVEGEVRSVYKSGGKVESRQLDADNLQ